VRWQDEFTNSSIHSVRDAGVESIMCAYNRTNDEACCGSNTLFREIFREEWGFDGHIVSDCWALHDFFEGHGVSADQVEAAARSTSARSSTW
jgi:beta-glucosidase